MAIIGKVMPRAHMTHVDSPAVHAVGNRQNSARPQFTATVVVDASAAGIYHLQILLFATASSSDDKHRPMRCEAACQCL